MSWGALDHFFVVAEQTWIDDFQVSSLLSGSEKVDDFHRGYLLETLEGLLMDAFSAVSY